jgi:SAM-dependent methyltransferase
MCAMRIEDMCCPACKGDLGFQPEAAASPPEATLGVVCTSCQLEYRVVEGIVDFLPADDLERSLAQRAMEATSVVSIYESGWWRASPLAAFLMQISLEEEMSLIERIASPSPRARVLDLACGPGLYARRFAARHPEREVVGLDLSWPMLRAATRKAAEARIENLRFVHGEAQALPFRDASLEVANCCGALHLFPDIPAALHELGRVLRPKGRFSMAVSLRGSGPLGRLRATAADTLWGLHFFSREELRALLDEAGFEPSIHHAKGAWMIAVGERRS